MSLPVEAILEHAGPVSEKLRSLAHPTRLRILCSLMEGEKSVMELTRFCGISQSAMSQFLGRMKQEGLVESRREQQFVYYSFADPKLVRLLRAIRDIYCRKGG